MDNGSTCADNDACCPGCASRSTSRIGPLPDANWFAGHRLADPMPGGFLHRCNECHLAFRHPLREETEYKALYDRPEPAVWSGNTRRRDWDLLAASAFAVRADARTLLDFGCHTGGLLSRFSAIPESYGIEVNDSAAVLARRMTGATVFPNLADIPAGLKFDLITACDVVEHVADPGALIRSLIDRLSDNGRLLITTGDADSPHWLRSGANWWYCFYPEHIAFISRRWLERREADGDFELLDCHNFRQGWLGSARRTWNRGLMIIYARYPKALLRVSGLARLLLRKGPPASMPGNGVEADHLFVVLGRNRQAKASAS